MKRKFSIIKFLICLVALGVFSWYESQLYKKYMFEENIRKNAIKVNTQKIEDAFLLREKDFYLDKNYIEKYKNMIQIEKLEEESLSGGEEVIEQVTGI
ncbi:MULTISPECIES: hypothetical protein [Fusobacterium]|uniref:Uncharacterized protein n=1 Tax=Fusobacterium hominis TaxID=2764326 RepID=A0A7G9GXQ0_9FUSO|nr:MULTISPECIES: hypothetical protein [Fusobacterium]QNM15582.1 hypothetical protein H9Q81_01705 [Fusobacterium hominis]